MDTIPIRALSPAILPAPTSNSTGTTSKCVRGEVTLLWPYSSTTSELAVLLADAEDPRQRERGGQVRVRFRDGVGKEISRSGSGLRIGDEVELSLEGCEFERAEGRSDDDVQTGGRAAGEMVGGVRTPGRCAEWELVFRRRLVMKVKYQGSITAEFDIDLPAAQQQQEIQQFEHAALATPSIPRSAAVQSQNRVATWESPAFLKRNRISIETIDLGNADSVLEDFPTSPEKRQRLSFGRKAWRYAEQTPSPVKSPQRPTIDFLESESGSGASQEEEASVSSSCQASPSLQVYSAVDREVSRLGWSAAQPVAASLEHDATSTPDLAQDGEVTEQFETRPDSVALDLAQVFDQTISTAEDGTTSGQLSEPPQTSAMLPPELPSPSRPQRPHVETPPRKPEIRAVASPSLPLPSPFPSAAEPITHFTWPPVAVPDEPPVTSEVDTIQAARLGLGLFAQYEDQPGEVDKTVLDATHTPDTLESHPPPSEVSAIVDRTQTSLEVIDLDDSESEDVAEDAQPAEVSASKSDGADAESDDVVEERGPTPNHDTGNLVQGQDGQHERDAVDEVNNDEDKSTSQAQAVDLSVDFPTANSQPLLVPSKLRDAPIVAYEIRRPERTTPEEMVEVDIHLNTRPTVLQPEHQSSQDSGLSDPPESSVDPPRPSTEGASTQTPPTSQVNTQITDAEPPLPSPRGLVKQTDGANESVPESSTRDNQAVASPPTRKTRSRTKAQNITLPNSPAVAADSELRSAATETDGPTPRTPKRRTKAPTPSANTDTLPPVSPTARTRAQTRKLREATPGSVPSPTTPTRRLRSSTLNSTSSPLQRLDAGTTVAIATAGSQERQEAQQGLRTALSYYAPLHSLSRYLNAPPPGTGKQLVDVIAIVSRDTRKPLRAAGGRRDWNTIFKITDRSLQEDESTPSSDGSGDAVEVIIHRPTKTSLPTASKGDVVILTGFSVASHKGAVQLHSSDESAWAVWDSVEIKHAASNSSLLLVPEPVVRGPPVEIGEGERRAVGSLSAWWSGRHAGAGP